MGFLEGKRVLVTGVASERSIAWGMVRSMLREGAEAALTCQNEKLRLRVESFAERYGCRLVLPCDVTEDSNIKNLFQTLQEEWPRLDGLVHSIAFAPREELNGNFVEVTTRSGFNSAHEVSSYSLTALARHARALMSDNGGAIVTLSYLGAEKTIANYNVMGLAKASLEANVRYLAAALGADNIRVNAISAGPIRTLAAAGIHDFRKMLTTVAKVAPLGKNISIEEIGNVGAFLVSHLASGITGEIIHVDNGFHIVGVPSATD